MSGREVTAVAESLLFTLGKSEAIMAVQAGFGWPCDKSGRDRAPQPELHPSLN